MQSLTLRFSETVRILADRARRAGLDMPAVRSPPEHPDADRTIRRRDDGGITVCVRLKDRPFAAVIADLIDAILTTNDVAPGDQQPIRRDMWKALADLGFVE